MNSQWVTQPTFQLPRTIVQSHRAKRPPFGPLGEVVYMHHYRRSVGGRMETWAETVERIVNGTFSILKNHCLMYRRPWNEDKATRSAIRMYEAIYTMKFLPPGRGLRYMGTEALSRDGGARLCNCAFVSTKDLGAKKWRPFAFAMDMLMVGVGVGFDVFGANQLMIPGPVGFTEHVVHDTRQGWVSALVELLRAHMEQKPLPIFDYRNIRPEGSPLVVSGGRSSGYQPLKAMLDRIHAILESRRGQYLESINILDIMNLIGKCIVSGNIRRSAMIALGDTTDWAFIHAKDPLMFPERNDWSSGWGGMSNNSVVVTVDQPYDEIVERTIKNGEPGFLWLENARRYGRMKDGPNDRDYRIRGTNPCAEQSLESYELCCLVETFPAKHEDITEYLNTLKAAYLYGKAVTLVDTHWDETNVVMQRNRRIGCSQSGIANAVGRFGYMPLFQWCDSAYCFLKGLDAQYSRWLDVEPSIKMTSVKPSGTVSLVAGETPGIHYPHSQYYIRRMQLSKDDPMVTTLERAGYVVEPYHNSDQTVVAEFPIHEPLATRFKDEVGLYEQMALAAAYQYWWADNQVSATITFKQEESRDLARALQLFAPQLKSISFLPLHTDYYPQMPYEAITAEEYGKRAAHLKPLQFTDEAIPLEEYCDTDHCTLK